MLTGQLNYSDKFGGPNTNRYLTAHTVFSISTEAVFAVAGALALFAPTPIKQPKGSSWSRADVHRYGMLGATGGMVAEAVLGFYTASREGYVNQSGVAAAHLAIGYTTLAFMMVAVGALVL
jgi:zinc transporter ZupT